jgi:hypothetical protein
MIYGKLGGKYKYGGVGIELALICSALQWEREIVVAVADDRRFNVGS